MDLIKALQDLKTQIQADLKVAADPESNAFHLAALDAVEYLLDTYL
jgi:hypothetical protein